MNDVVRGRFTAKKLIRRVLAQLTKKKRKNGPGTAYAQQYLCRGKYLEEDGDEDDDDDDAPEPNTYWIDEADLLETIAKDDVKAALVARHDRHAMSACWRICELCARSRLVAGYSWL